MDSTAGRIKFFTSAPVPPGLEEETRKCVILWREVMDQCLTDVVRGIKLAPSRAAADILAKQAYSWLYRKTPQDKKDFEVVCELAMFKPQHAAAAIDWYMENKNDR